MGIFDDIQRAFNPNDNGLNKSIQHTNEVLSQTFDPNKNKVADTFKESFTDFGTRVDKSIKMVFGDNGVLDNTIIKPSDNFFKSTLPKTTIDISNKIDTGFKQKLADPANIFFKSTLPTGANQFFNDVKNEGLPIVSHLPIIGGILPHSSTLTSSPLPPSLSSPSSPISQGRALNHSVVLKLPTEESTNSYMVPLVIGGAIFAFILLQK